ncbi:hypothetical protein K4F52_004487 [Lecanicillium sp. MT-2017a]|nr:hypothetical protein K4F52_004487 [Lecanicillium sp. MT-2017a]
MLLQEATDNATTKPVSFPQPPFTPRSMSSSMPSDTSPRRGSNSAPPSTSASSISSAAPLQLPTPALAPARISQPPPSRRPSPASLANIQPTVRQLLDSLATNRVNTLTELCRIERIAATCEDEEDARAFQGPMTTAWTRYVVSNQLLTELRGLTRGYPFSADLVQEAHARVLADPQSNRSWNLAWLCLTRMRDDELIRFFAILEAGKPEMWAGLEPGEDDMARLASCFEREWSLAVNVMLRHWNSPPSWY